MKNIILFCVIIMNLMLYGKEPEELLNEGIIYLKTGDYDKSIKILEEATRTISDNADVYYYLGESYFRKGDSEKAISNLQKAISINSQNPSYYYTLAIVYISQNKNKEAIEALNKVISISPLGLYGKSAVRLKGEIESKEKDIEIVKKWEKEEIEERKRKEEMKKEKEESQLKQGLPPTSETLPSELIQTQQEPEKNKVPIITILKRIKFGREDVRKKASSEIIGYPSKEIEKVITDIIEIIKNEGIPEIKRNLIIAAGKVNNPEVVDMLLDIIKNENELFEIRIVALDCISNLKSEKVVEELRYALTNMISRREREREDARRNIQDINQKLDDLTVRKIFLNSEIQNLNNRIAQIDSQLFQEGTLPSEGPPAFTQGGRALTETQIKKLREERRLNEEKINKNNEEIAKIDKELEELNVKKRRYEDLLELRKRKIDISSIGISTPITQIEYGKSPDLPVGSIYSQGETDEQKNEIILAIKIINALANLRDTDSISIIKRAWREFGTPGLRIYYYIALGKLGEYRSIDLMVSRLKENYPQGNVEEEIYIRMNIIEVLGEYLKNNPDQGIKELIEYLVEEGEYPQIQNAAKKAISSLAKTENN
ncbi:MAG: tetratricopeptide repeat protein [bacterium]|nr:tetratricopeptide repeat protein [bacterium]